jgi:hypothetical protein
VRRIVPATLFVAVAGIAGCGLLPDERLLPMANTCGQWDELDDGDQSATAAALVDDRLDVARSIQQLPEDADRVEIVDAVRGSIDKACELDGRPGLRLTDVVDGLYGGPPR